MAPHRTSSHGYYRYPTIQGDTVVFVCEDDLWMVPAGGGTAQRLTSHVGDMSYPFLSPDGQAVAFTGRGEGHAEVYVMPTPSGEERRLTFLGSLAQVVGWSPDSQEIIFASNAGQPFAKLMKLYAVDRLGSLPRPLNLGPARNLSYGPKGGVVLGRHTTHPARWKRYRGGTAGDIWVDPKGAGKFKRLVRLGGNLACPMWVGERIYFVSDHEGIGNLYSVKPSGDDLQRHTDHDDYYIANATTDGKRIVYQCGSDLFLFEPGVDKDDHRIPVDFHSHRTQRNRKFVNAARFLEDYALHPAGHSLAIITRGKPFTFGNWEGPILQHGVPDGARYRLAVWLNDGKRIAAVGDENGEEHLVVFPIDGAKPPVHLSKLDIGRPLEMLVSPRKDRDQVLIHNHRCEILLADLGTKKIKVLDKSRHGRVDGMAWSPDGRWVAYNMPLTHNTAIIKLCKVETGETYPVTRPVLRDVAPAFDPEGKYLYFLSYRVFDPVYDNMLFDLGFPRGMRPYLVTLRKDLRSPFLPLPHSEDEDPDKEEKAEKTTKAEKAAAAKKKAGKDGKDKPPPEKPLRIDLAGIEDRVVAFPVPEGRYEQIRGLPKGRVLFTSFPVEGSLGGGEDGGRGTLEIYDFNELRRETIVGDVSDFELSRDYKWMIYRSARNLRVLKAGEKRREEGSREPAGRKSGWIDLARVKVSVLPPAEWEQMYREAWRLQRDHFWTPDMSGVDWQRIYDRYKPLLDRIATRTEFSDLMWEMQGELGTSHAYESGGDHRAEPLYRQGYLGADFVYDEKADGFRVTHVIQGDSWDPAKDSPLNTPGVNVRPGSVLLSIGGRRLSRKVTPQKLLVNQAGSELLLTFAQGKGTRTVAVKALRDETPARYREWVEVNRQHVHKATAGRAGYVHIPNMGPLGYSEFHRYYLAEVHHDGMIIDVRYNGGGHVSQLILEKLIRRRIGYDLQRWGEVQPYPLDSVLGPKVALTNEQAGSDGDIFSHCFKLLELGPLIGKRTWGGVIGIWPRHTLVDGGVTTQPEFSFWFEDVGWAVENYGTDPDIEVDVAPQDDAHGRDPQLDRAVEEVLKLLAEHPPKVPDFGNRPHLALPKLPPRPGARKQR